MLLFLFNIFIRYLFPNSFNDESISENVNGTESSTDITDTPGSSSVHTHSDSNSGTDNFNFDKNLNDTKTKTENNFSNTQINSNSIDKQLNFLECNICCESTPIHHLIKFCNTEKCINDNLCKNCFLSYIKIQLSKFNHCRSPCCGVTLSKLYLFEKFFKIIKPSEESRYSRIDLENWEFTDKNNMSLLFYTQSDDIVKKYMNTTEIYEIFKDIFTLKNIVYELYKDCNDKCYCIGYPIHLYDSQQLITGIILQELDIESIQHLIDFVKSIKKFSIESDIINVLSPIFLNLINILKAESMSLRVTVESTRYLEFFSDHNMIKPKPISIPKITIIYDNETVFKINDIISEASFGVVKTLSFQLDPKNQPTTSIPHQPIQPQPQPQPQPIELETEKNQNFISFKELRLVTITDNHFSNVKIILQIVSKIKIKNNPILNLFIQHRHYKDERSDILKAPTISLPNTCLYINLDDVKKFDNFFSLFWGTVKDLHGMNVHYHNTTKWHGGYFFGESFKIRCIRFIFDIQKISSEDIESNNSNTNDNSNSINNINSTGVSYDYKNSDYDDMLGNITIATTSIRKLHLINSSKENVDMIRNIRLDSQEIELVLFNKSLNAQLADVCRFFDRLDKLEYLIIKGGVNINYIAEDDDIDKNINVNDTDTNTNTNKDTNTNTNTQGIEDKNKDKENKNEAIQPPQLLQYLQHSQQLHQQGTSKDTRQTQTLETPKNLDNISMVLKKNLKILRVVNVIFYTGPLNNPDFSMLFNYIVTAKTFHYQINSANLSTILPVLSVLPITKNKNKDNYSNSNCLSLIRSEHLELIVFDETIPISTPTSTPTNTSASASASPSPSRDGAGEGFRDGAGEGYRAYFGLCINKHMVEVLKSNNPNLKRILHGNIRNIYNKTKHKFSKVYKVKVRGSFWDKEYHEYDEYNNYPILQSEYISEYILGSSFGSEYRLGSEYVLGSSLGLGSELEPEFFDRLIDNMEGYKKFVWNGVEVYECIDV